MNRPPRRYDIARSLVDLPEPAATEPQAYIRAGIKAPPKPAAISEDALASTASSAFLIAEGDSQWFEVSIRDEIFPHLRCKIGSQAGKICAVFEVADKNTQRLLEASAGRLRVMLESRGLKVAEIRVTLA